MKRPFLPAAILAVALCLPAHAAERVALVIGNNTYDSTKPADAKPNLMNAVQDATAVRQMLVGQLGFAQENVIFGRDLGRVETMELLEKFRAKAVRAELAMIYYAGHGMESLNGVSNFMIPVDADPAAVSASDARLRAMGVNVAEEIRLLKEAAPDAAKVVLLDCCRERPAGRNLNGVRGGGLAQLKDDTILTGTLVMLAAAPGRLASDGRKHGPFTEALLEKMPVPGQTLLESFYAVSDRVEELTNKSQLPWLKTDGSARLFRELVLLPGNGTRPAVASLLRPPVEVDQSAAFAGKRAGERKVLKMEGVEVALRWCPPGNFTMGSPKTEEDRADAENQVQVRLTQGFWLAETECTQEQWQAVMGSNPSEFKGAKRPVEYVSWEDAQKYLGKLNASGGLPAGWKWTLPSEAQWEYACRAGTTTVFAFGDSLGSRQANFNGEYPYGGASEGPYLKRTTDVGSYPANGWGLYDMHGNVWEWCEDWYAGGLGGGVDPAGPLTGSDRVYRGGGWYCNGRNCRSARRSRPSPDSRCDNLGFRLAAVPAGR